MMISIQYSEDPKLRKAQKFALWTCVGLFGTAAFGLLFGFLIQFLWNATLAEMFGFPALSFWQAIGLFILAKLFFGFGGGGGSSRSGRKRKKKKESDDQGPGVEPEDAAGLPDDEAFRKYWRQEGRESYDAYRKTGLGNETSD
jgi:hypothetical protein